MTEFGPVRMDWKMDHRHRPAITYPIPENVKARIRLRSQTTTDALDLDGKAIQS
jgi:hypothetical protein